MRTAWDALRSVKRYTALALGDDWEVRLASEQGAFRYPYARVARVGATLMGGSAHLTDYTQPLVIHLYPEPGATASETLERCAAVEELLYRGFRVGTGNGRPLRIPLFDYTGVALDDASTKSGLTVRGTGGYSVHGDFLRVLDGPSVSFLADADDDRRIMVAADLRIGWRRDPHQVPDAPGVETGPIVQDVQPNRPPGHPHEQPITGDEDVSLNWIT